MKFKINILAFCLVIITTNSLLSDNVFNRIRYLEFVGARPLSMGETFVAVADDINAIYWNPAGLPAINHLGINSMHANLFNSNVDFNYLGVSIPGLPKTSFGVDWVNIGYDDSELKYGKNKINLSAGYQPFTRLSVGFSLKYLRMNGASYQLSRVFDGWGGDIGLLYRPHPKWKFGVVVHDFTNTTLKGVEGPLYNRNLRVGAAYRVFDNLLIATDLDDRFHLGSEWRIFNDLLALRAGLQHDFYTDEDMTFSYGLGLDIPLWGQRIRFDYAFTDTPMLPNTHRTSLSFLIDLFPRLIKIKKVEIEPIYASLYKYHSKNPIGKVYIDYKGDKELDCKITVSVDKFGSKRTKNIVIPATSVDETIQPISINTVFNDSVLYERDNIPLIADIKISYMSGNKQKEELQSQNFYLFSRNAINWQEGAGQAAAFITPNDPVVKQFVRIALSENETLQQKKIKNEQFTKSMQLFKAVSQYGMHYEEDSNSPYSKTYQAFDNIYYPAQLFREKRGDCDDLVVLFASLLESKNISTALVSVPGHIFLLFNSGLHPRRSFQLCCADNQYCVLDDQIWLPLETTWIDSSFNQAWKKGAEVFNRYSEDLRQIIKVHDAWEMYEPVAYAGKYVKPFQNLPQERFAQEKEQINRDDAKYLSDLEKNVVQHPDSTQLRNRLAITYAFQNQHKNAENHFRALLKKDKTNFFALNNLGNLFFSNGKLDSAFNYYQKALDYATGEKNDGIHLNLGLVYAAADLDSMAVEKFALVMKDSTGYKRINDLLGLSIKEEDFAKANELKVVKKVSSGSVKVLAAKADEKRKNKSKQKYKSKQKNKKRRRKDLINAGGKGSLPKDNIENVFYWAF